jgi:hypothetical protein
MKYVAVITRSGQQYPVRMYTHHMVRRGFLLLLDRCVAKVKGPREFITVILEMGLYAT